MKPSTMHRAAWLAGLLAAVSARADLTWRIDFNGTTSATESSPASTGWVISNTSRTQTFANVDGGPTSSNMTLALNGSGGTTYSTYQRNMTGGAATNLFRDGAQYNGLDAGEFLNLRMSGLSAGQSYQVRLWNYDYTFGTSATQSYFDVTGGGSTFLGALTNTVNNVAAGNAALPADVYDSRYVLTATLTADGSGVMEVNLLTGSSNQKINALEVTALVPEPGTATLLIAAASLLWFRRRR